MNLLSLHDPCERWNRRSCPSRLVDTYRLHRSTTVDGLLSPKEGNNLKKQKTKKKAGESECFRVQLSANADLNQSRGPPYGNALLTKSNKNEGYLTTYESKRMEKTMVFLICSLCWYMGIGRKRESELRSALRFIITAVIILIATSIIDLLTRLEFLDNILETLNLLTFQISCSIIGNGFDEGSILER